MSCTQLQLSGYSATLAIDFFVTLAVFPSISSAICSVRDQNATFPCSATTPSGRFYGEQRVAWSINCMAGRMHKQCSTYMTCKPAECLSAGAGDLFVPFMFLMFNGGDLLGRGLASLGPWAVKPPPTAVLLTYALSRVALLVGLMFCNVITPHQWRLPRLIRSVKSIRVATSDTR